MRGEEICTVAAVVVEGRRVEEICTAAATSRSSSTCNKHTSEHTAKK